MPHALTRGRLAVGVSLAVVYVVWGSTYLGIAVAIETLPPLLMGGARFLVAGAILYALASRFGNRGRGSPTRRQWLGAAATGLPLFLFGNGMVAVAQQTVASGVAALIVATVPLWIVLLDRFAFRGRLSLLVLVGVGIGFAGVALLVDPTGPGDVDRAGALLLVLASAGWAVGSLLSRTVPLPANPLLGAGMQMLAGGAALVVAAVASGELADVRLAQLSGRSSVAFAYLIVFGSILAFSAYAWLLRNAATALVSTYAYVNPIVAVFLGWAVLDEAITGRALVAGAIIVVAVALIVTAQARERPPAAATAAAPPETVDRPRVAAAIRGR